jgi:hypothetical protein
LVCNILLQEVGESRFEYGALPFLEHTELAFIVINADHVIAAFSKTCPYDKAYIAGAYDAQFHCWILLR